eukprot:10817345-Lingulodinium_polyedra.AAC.1
MARKPTGLWSAGPTGLANSIQRLPGNGRCHHRVRHPPLAGRDEQGRWRTAQAKEWPPGLCWLLARATAQYIQQYNDWPQQPVPWDPA